MRSEKRLHPAERFLGRGDQAHTHGPVGLRPHFRGVQIHKGLSDLAEDCEGHGCDWADDGARNITRSSLLHSIPTPIRSTWIWGEKYRSTVSLAGWNSSAGATSSSRGGPARSGTPGKYPRPSNSPRSRCHLTRIQ